MANVKAVASRVWGLFWGSQPAWSKRFPLPSAPLCASSRVITAEGEEAQESQLGRRLVAVLKRRRIPVRALVTAAALVATRRALGESKGVPLRLSTAQQVDLRPFCSRGGNTNQFNLHGWLSTFLQVILDAPHIDPEDPVGLWDLCEEVDRQLVILRDPTLPIQALHLGSWLRGDPEETVTQPPHAGRLTSDFGIVCFSAWKTKSSQAAVKQMWASTASPHMGAPITYQGVVVEDQLRHMVVYHSGYVGAELAQRCQTHFRDALRTAAMPLPDDSL